MGCGGKAAFARRLDRDPQRVPQPPRWAAAAKPPSPDADRRRTLPVPRPSAIGPPRRHGPETTPPEEETRDLLPGDSTDGADAQEPGRRPRQGDEAGRGPQV